MLVLSRIEMTLGEFVQQEMARRKIRSNREFARQVGVSPQLINDLINEKDRELDVPSLIKLSNFTRMSITTLIKLAFPNAVHIDLDIESILDAERISKLPPDKRAVIRGYISDAYNQSRNEISENNHTNNASRLDETPYTERDLSILGRITLALLRSGGGQLPPQIKTLVDQAARESEDASRTVQEQATDDG